MFEFRSRVDRIYIIYLYMLVIVNNLVVCTLTYQYFLFIKYFVLHFMEKFVKCYNHVSSPFLSFWSCSMLQIPFAVSMYDQLGLSVLCLLYYAYIYCSKKLSQ